MILSSVFSSLKRKVEVIKHSVYSLYNFAASDQSTAMFMYNCFVQTDNIVYQRPVPRHTELLIADARLIKLLAPKILYLYPTTGRAG